MLLAVDAARERAALVAGALGPTCRNVVLLCCHPPPAEAEEDLLRQIRTGRIGASPVEADVVAHHRKHGGLGRHPDRKEQQPELFFAMKIVDRHTAAASSERLRESRPGSSTPGAPRRPRGGGRGVSAADPLARPQPRRAKCVARSRAPRTAARPPASVGSAKAVAPAAGVSPALQPSCRPSPRAWRGAALLHRLAGAHAKTSQPLSPSFFTL